MVLSPLGHKHSETTKPKKFRGGIHGWRNSLVDNLVQKGKIHKNFLIFFKNFQIQSNISRYLIQPVNPKAQRYISLNQVAKDYFSYQDIKDFFNKDLNFLEKEVSKYCTQGPVQSKKSFNLLSFINNFLSR